MVLVGKEGEREGGQFDVIWQDAHRQNEDSCANKGGQYRASRREVPRHEKIRQAASARRHGGPVGT